jgi:hypothetical protein
LQIEIIGNEFFRPVIFGKIVTENKLWIVAIAKEIALSDWFNLVVIEFESMFIRELNNTVF